MRKQKKKLYRKIHGILFARAIEDFCYKLALELYEHNKGYQPEIIVVPRKMVYQD